ncbi:class I SAM-dependent methyltransferase [Undibacterium sp. SXout7W]|uniref:class I SAM-dependent methyltransferase n=1 Tax=Undibacterium sp. SXout7W TaxID=3413049 RepID=UPI003BF2B4C1
MSEQKMRDYYAQRAATLEQIYDKPERQHDLREIQQRVVSVLSGHQVLELACGTGYWTERYAPFASAVHATDINQSMLDIAQAKSFPEGQVQFAIADAFAMPDAVPDQYTACFAGFFWSHIKREEQTNWLSRIHKAAGKGSVLVLIDNNYVEGSSTTIARTDLEGNTYQLRMQEDGSRVEIVKNFPTDSALRKKFGPSVRDIRIFRNTHYWMLSCVLK